ncbi:MAG: polyisoprenoid-binding protein [Rhodospirillales bacterium]|nr:polyisoprenoid-binding protein [Alphaproteobacteria bacterium]MCB1839234.1 polyisoprenoid-binding protein [Alphaproteobacteria bacterium]MCB9977281.1 polyisoprenoid-binding protein [Rhodospirillales bacterium]
MKKFLGLAAAALCLMSVRPAYAETEQYAFDKLHTQIIFFVSHLGYSHSEGKFLDFDGGFTFDRTDPSKSSVEVTINTAGLNMDDQKWDDHLKSADFFDVEKFPTMTFKSTNVEVTGDDTANITGDLTLLGVTKPVTLAVKHNKSGKHPFGDKYVSGFSATATIKRSDFGMKYGLPLLGDDVDIHIEVEGDRVEPTASDAASDNK